MAGRGGVTVLFSDQAAKTAFGMSVITARDELSSVPGRFGWDGGLGTSGYTDPYERLIGIVMTQRMWDSPSPPPLVRVFLDTRLRGDRRLSHVSVRPPELAEALQRVGCTHPPGSATVRARARFVSGWRLVRIPSGLRCNVRVLRGNRRARSGAGGSREALVLGRGYQQCQALARAQTPCLRPRHG